MPLKISLKPNEKIYINGAVLKNGKSTINISIENNASILRQNNIMKEEDITTYCEKIYYVIQLMYIDQDNLQKYTEEYWILIKMLIDTVPTLTEKIHNMNHLILDKKYYQALRKASELISMEKEYIENV
jgi:flagellar biosynthesis repressor protein FlbT